MLIPWFQITKVRRRIFLRSLFWTAFACAVVSMVIIQLYPREEWLWELSLSNALTVVLTMSITTYIGVKVEQVTALSEKLRDLVERDRLTDVATRDYFFERLEDDNQAYGVSLMIDIDHFKQVNDVYGHLAGDIVIRNVAQILRDCVRERDIVCRFGGEEFVIFLDGATPQIGREIAERIRGRTESFVSDTDEGEVRVTVSLGGSLKERLEEVEEAIRRADECLYKAKALGRNRTIFDWDMAEAA